ncbi:calcium-binding protein, partial [Xanthomonas campestris pv. raphani]|uniref:calcium-binding protein n=1 Tax=Xanthomonas campestris TaxID=339 RepID=UPI002B23A51C
AGGIYDTWNGYYNGPGNDTYQFGRGDGQDRIVDFDSTAKNIDVLSLGGGIEESQIWFRRIGSDLEVSIIGTRDSVTINNWYSSSAYHVEQFQTSSGKILFDSQVDSLVSAMSSLTPPAVGQTVLSEEYQASLNQVLAANWK